MLLCLAIALAIVFFHAVGIKDQAEHSPVCVEFGLSWFGAFQERVQIVDLDWIAVGGSLAVDNGPQNAGRVIPLFRSLGPIHAKQLPQGVRAWVKSKPAG